MGFVERSSRRIRKKYPPHWPVKHETEGDRGRWFHHRTCLATDFAIIQPTLSPYRLIGVKESSPGRGPNCFRHVSSLLPGRHCCRRHALFSSFCFRSSTC